MSAARCTSPVASARVLPSSRVSNSASSVLRASRSCEVLLRMRPRAMGVIAAQAGKAAFAAVMAAAASSRPLAGYSATNSRWSAGLKFLNVWLDFAPTHSPAMKFWQVRVIIMNLGHAIPSTRSEMNPFCVAELERLERRGTNSVVDIQTVRTTACPSPRPSPSGRGRTMAPPWAKRIAPVRRTTAEETHSGAMNLPLPQGEGRGEGERALQFRRALNNGIALAERNSAVLQLLLQLRDLAEVPAVFVRVANFAKVVQRLFGIAGPLVGHRELRTRPIRPLRRAGPIEVGFVHVDDVIEFLVAAENVDALVQEILRVESRTAVRTIGQDPVRGDEPFADARRDPAVLRVAQRVATGIERQRDAGALVVGIRAGKEPPGDPKLAANENVHFGVAGGLAELVAEFVRELVPRRGQFAGGSHAGRDSTPLQTLLQRPEIFDNRLELRFPGEQFGTRAGLLSQVLGARAKVS